MAGGCGRRMRHATFLLACTARQLQVAAGGSSGPSLTAACGAGAYSAAGQDLAAALTCLARRLLSYTSDHQHEASCSSGGPGGSSAIFPPLSLNKSQPHSASISISPGGGRSLIISPAQSVATIFWGHQRAAGSGAVWQQQWRATQSSGPGPPPINRSPLTQEEVLHELGQQYQQATGEHCLPPMTESMKEYLCKWICLQGDPSTWMDGVRDMIAEVGPEAVKLMVVHTPHLLMRAPGRLARDIGVYMEATGWSRGEVVGWMLQPRASFLLSRSAVAVICNLKSIAAHLGLVPPHDGLVQLMRERPEAATSNPETMIKNLVALHQLQATHPKWEQQYGGFRLSTLLNMARGPASMSRVRYVVEWGQQERIPMSAAARNTVSFTRVLPHYVAPPRRASRLSPDEGARQVEQCLARWPPWRASWERLERITRADYSYKAQNPERLLRLEYLLDQGLQGSCTVGQALKLAPKRWLACYPGFTAWRAERGPGCPPTPPPKRARASTSTSGGGVVHAGEGRGGG